MSEGGAYDLQKALASLDAASLQVAVSLDAVSLSSSQGLLRNGRAAMNDKTDREKKEIVSYLFLASWLSEVRQPRLQILGRLAWRYYAPR